jgi:hypothetical protein
MAFQAGTKEGSISALAARYVALDYNMPIKEIQEHIKQDHGVDANGKTISSARVLYLRSIGAIPKEPGGRGRKYGKIHFPNSARNGDAHKASVAVAEVLETIATNDLAGRLENFTTAVRQVGGVESAKKILTFLKD